MLIIHHLYDLPLNCVLTILNVQDSTTREIQSPMPMSVEDSINLMAYIDKVFPLQYPVYDSDEAGGRGWLLSIMMRATAFYHAALALGACYRASHTKSPIIRAAGLVQEGEHLQRAIAQLNGAHQETCMKTRLGLLAAMAQVFFFEAGLHSSRLSERRY